MRAFLLLSVAGLRPEARQAAQHHLLCVCRPGSNLGAPAGLLFLARVVGLLTAVLGMRFLGIDRHTEFQGRCEQSAVKAESSESSTVILLLAALQLLPRGQHACVNQRSVANDPFQNRSTVFASFFFFAKPPLLVGRRVAEEKEGGPASALALAAFISACPRSGSSAS